MQLDTEGYSLELQMKVPEDSFQALVQSQSGGQCVEKKCWLRNVPGRTRKYEEKQEIHTHAHCKAKQSEVQYKACTHKILTK